MLRTEGPWLEADLQIGDMVLTVMDEFALSAYTSPSVGDEFEVELSAEVDHEVSLESLFAGNPEQLRKIERTKGWSYQAYGKVISINPVVVDCGILLVPDVFHTNDPRVIGEFVGFPISRLNAVRET